MSTSTRPHVSEPPHPPLREEWQFAFDTLPGLVWTALPDGSIDYLNRGWLNYTGLRLDEATGWGWQKSIHADDRDSLVRHWRSMRGARAIEDTEARLRRADGTYRWFLFRALPLFDDAGRLLKWYGQATDIDERKRMERLLAGEKSVLEQVARAEALPEILERICRVVEELGEDCRCGIVLIDPRTNRLRYAAGPSLPAGYVASIDGRPVTAMEGPCAMAAAHKTAVIVSNVATDPRWRDSFWPPLALRHGLASCWAAPIVSRAGDALGTFSVYRSQPAGPSQRDENVIEQFSSIASIAIERSQAAERLRRSEAYLAEAQRLSQTGSLSCHLPLSRIVWSEETYRIYELDPSIPPSPEAIRARVHPDDRELFDRYAMGAVPTDGTLQFEHRLRFPDGRTKHLQIVATAQRDAHGRTGEFVGAVRDVTELKEREASLNRVRAELAHVTRASTVGTLAASIAHEVNQPLAGILTNGSLCLRLLAREPAEVGEAADAVRRAIRDANRAADVVARLRALFRRQPIARDSFDLKLALEEVLPLLGDEIQKARVALRVALAADLPLVAGDRLQIQQVALNLVANAIEAMPEVGTGAREVVVEARHVGACVRVDVRDSGRGVDAETLERLFEPFYTTKPNGMGVGLFVGRAIVESHGGKLDVARNEGAGATFTFSLPTA